MPTSTKLVRDDLFENMATMYQSLLTAALDQTLAENGIGDSAIRQKICEEFVFWHGNLHDQMWIKQSGGERIFPLLCFTKRFLNIGTPVDELGDVFAGAQFFSWHEYALGSVAAHFEQGPADIEMGCVGPSDV